MPRLIRCDGDRAAKLIAVESFAGEVAAAAPARNRYNFLAAVSLCVGEDCW